VPSDGSERRRCSGPSSAPAHRVSGAAQRIPPAAEVADGLGEGDADPGMDRVPVRAVRQQAGGYVGVVRPSALLRRPAQGKALGGRDLSTRFRVAPRPVSPTRRTDRGRRIIARHLRGRMPGHRNRRVSGSSSGSTG
jgi:hypothetical protein